MHARARIALWGLAGLLAAGTAGAATLEERGMAGLYDSPRLTVVYPTRPEAGVDEARRSAEQRASFLRAVHGTETTVAADDEVAGAALTGDLLVLGWENRLLGTSRAPAPFSRDERSLALDGELRFGPGLDLAFVHASPYNPARRLYFWSRIDPELDRFRVLPSEGSAWIVFDRFLPVAQGMWMPGASWPPRRDPDAERDHRETLAAERARAGRVRRGAYDVVYDPEAVSAEAVEAVVRARTDALAAATRALGGSLPDDFRIELHVYADEDAKTRLTGVLGGVHSVPTAGELHMTEPYARTPNPHEEFHLIAARRYGPSYSTAIFEGVAVAAEGRYREQDLAVHAAVLLDRGAFPTVAALLDEGAIRAAGTGVAFPASALLVEWIRATAGEDGLARAHARRYPTVATLAADVGIPAAEVEPRFLARTRERAAEARDELTVLERLEEARERHVAGDYRGVATALRAILELRPDDVQTIFNLASAEMRTGEYASAEKHLREVLAADRPTDDPLRVFGHYQLGRVYDLMGRREDAIAQYRRVLELPDVHDSHRSAQDALASPFTPERLE